MIDEPSPPEDAELLRSVRAGDADAFKSLYRRYHGVVYRFALQMSGRVAIAEDITQETFLALADGAPSYDPGQAKFSTYVYGIVRNLTKRQLRDERSFVALSGRMVERWKAHEPLIENSLVQAAAQTEVTGRVRRAILDLPPRYREVVVLCDLHGRRYTEAAAIVGCTFGAVQSRLHRGRALLRRKLRRTYEGSLGGHHACVRHW